MSHPMSNAPMPGTPMPGTPMSGTPVSGTRAAARAGTNRLPAYAAFIISFVFAAALVFGLVG